MDHVAAQDQLEASAAAIANMAHTLVMALMRVGFTRDEAVFVVTDWLGETWRN